MRWRQHRRMCLCLAMVLIIASLAVWQLYQIQMVQGENWARQARAINSQTMPLEDFQRGDITDRHGTSLLHGYWANKIVIFPPLLPDSPEVRDKIAQGLGLSLSNLHHMLDQARHKAFYLTAPLTQSQYQLFHAGDWPGICVLPVFHRYGQQPLAVHVVGHLGKIDSLGQFNQIKAVSPGKQYQLDDWVGRAGLELFYEQRLKGDTTDRRASVAVDARDRLIAGHHIEVVTAGSASDRCAVVTTIDHRVQQVVEDVLDQYVHTTGAVVVMQPGSGDILAMASRPNYHPHPQRMQKSLQSSDAEVFVNHTTALYQPGSVFKTVLAAAALEQGLEKAKNPATFYCQGEQALSISCWHAPGHGEINLSQALVQSCNPAFVQLGQQLGAATILHYAALLGLTNQSIAGYPMANDPRQDLTAMARDFNLSNSAIGQGPVLVTPVQVTAMMNVLASGGFYHQPQLVLEVRDGQGKPVQKITPPRPEQVLSDATVEQLQLMLQEVTSAGGVGHKAAVPVWGSAGKTGSAQLTSAKGPVNAWFSGYVPAPNPRYVITVLIPKGNSGGSTAAPIFQAIGTGLMQLQ